MRYIGIIILLVLCLTLLLFTGRIINTVTPEPASGNLENQEDINQSSNNFQSSSAGLVYETVIADAEESVTVYPQQWATGDGTVGDPWANNCLNTALTNVPIGGTIFLRAGYYQLAGKLTFTKQVNIIGEDRVNTIIITADEHGLEVDGNSYDVDYTTIKNLTIDGDAQATQGNNCCIKVARCEYVLLENIEVKNAGNFGIDTNTMNHSSLLNIYAHDNGEHGVHSGTDISGNNMHNTYRNIYAWNNTESGFDDRGDEAHPDLDTYNLYDNLQCWDNGKHGIAIFAQHSGIISNSSVSNNGQRGLNLCWLENFDIHDCHIDLTDEEGIFVSYSDNLNFTNVIVKNNNVSDDNISGITVRESNGIRFTSCQSYDDRETPLQAYGIKLTGANTNISLVNCKLTPNKEGEIYNPAGGSTYSNYRKMGVSPSVIVRE